MTALPYPALTASFKVDELQLSYRRRRFQSPGPQLRSPEDVHRFLVPVIAYAPREKLVSLALNSANHIIGLEIVATGATNAATAVPAEVFKALLLCNATAFILAHNHPSGNPQPSDQDLALSAMLNFSAEALGIKMLDHIIVCREEFISLELNRPDWRKYRFRPSEDQP